MDIRDAIRAKLKGGSSKPSMSPAMGMEEDGEMMEDSDDMGLTSAAEEMMSAAESGDTAGFVEALKSFIDQYVG